jgi:hypothetical protein
MSTKKKSGKQKDAKQNRPRSSTGSSARSLYADFEIWDNRKRPLWHPVKKMRYVFFRMIDGCTITDALKEIRWNANEFWHLVDLKRNAPFRVEYSRAKKLQGRAFGDSVISIADGRDETSKAALRKIRRVVRRGLTKVGRQKSPLAAKAMIESLLAQLDMNEHRIIARNKLQIDAKKWLAKAVNPMEFSEKSSLALTGAPDGSGAQKPVLVQFIDPSGKPVAP